jgi:hypothetical protein
MADILANPVEICFGSFMVTSTTLAVATSPTASMKTLTTSDAAPSSGKKSKTHPPKPYDIVQGMERFIDMMEETLQICERAQRSTQDASHRKTFPFDLRPQRRVHSIIGEVDLDPIWATATIWRPQGQNLHLSRPLDVPCIYHKGARHTLRGCRLRKKIDQDRDASRAAKTPTSPDDGEFQKVRIRISSNG